MEHVGGTREYKNKDSVWVSVIVTTGHATAHPMIGFTTSMRHACSRPSATVTMRTDNGVRVRDLWNALDLYIIDICADDFAWTAIMLVNFLYFAPSIT